MKPYITTEEAAIIYAEKRNFSPAAFRAFLYAGAKREFEENINYGHLWKTDFQEWLKELQKFDLCFEIWAIPDHQERR